MPSLDRADPVILGHILQEHRELHALLRSTREAVRQTLETPAARPKPVGCQRIAAALTNLRNHLQEHF